MPEKLGQLPFPVEWTFIRQNGIHVYAHERKVSKNKLPEVFATDLVPKRLKRDSGGFADSIKIATLPETRGVFRSIFVINLTAVQHTIVCCNAGSIHFSIKLNCSRCQILA